MFHFVCKFHVSHIWWLVQLPYWFKAGFYQPQRSCGQGNIFTPVCHSVHRGGGVSEATPQEQTPPLGQTPPRTKYTTTTTTTTTPLGTKYTPPRSRLWHTVNERPVCILLECIFVSFYFWGIFSHELQKIILHEVRFNNVTLDRTLNKLRNLLF